MSEKNSITLEQNEVILGRGLRGTTVDSSSICHIEGDKGLLCYRGYSIEELAGKVNYEDVVHLLWYGELPSPTEREAFVTKMRASRMLPNEILALLKTIPTNANPMDAIRTSISMLGALEENTPPDSFNDEVNNERALKILANLPIIVAAFHRIRTDKPIPEIRHDLNEAAHFLYLLTGKVPNPNIISTLDLLYILQAEHSFNNSTFSSRVIISSKTDLYSAITAAIGSLKGPLHGGANQGIIPMLKDIGSVDNVAPWIHDKLAKKELIMGIGHPVYKTYDPRAMLLKNVLNEFSEELENDTWIKLSNAIQQIMLEEKNLYANIDFYSAPVYHSLGIPSDLFTPIFAIARTGGWIAHAFEQIKNKSIYRPKAKYVGAPSGKKVS